MKLENCGRCGHEAVIKVESVQPCPCCGNCPDGEFYPDFAEWDKAQRSIRTDRINAAALAIAAARATPTVQGGVSDFVPFTRPYLVPVDCDAALSVATRLIDEQDRAAQARFRAMQGGDQ